MRSVSRMRKQLLDMYPGSAVWAYRVEHMGDNQVIAIYLTSYEKRMKALTKDEPENLAEQLCMFEDIDKDVKKRKEWVETHGHLYE